MPDTQKPPRVGNPKVDFLLSVNRLLAAAEDARNCRDELFEASATEEERNSQNGQE